MTDSRPSWDEYFMNLAHEVSKRATCDRGKNGAVLVRNKRILTTGYVGAPSGLPHCDEVGHLFEKREDKDGEASKHCIRTTHAEQNAILQAALHGVSTKGAILYTKMEPCLDCAKMIINAGISKVVCGKKYHKGEMSRKFMKDADIKIEYMNDEVMNYEDQK